MTIRAQTFALILGANVFTLAAVASVFVLFGARQELLAELRSLAELVGIQALSGLSSGDPASVELAVLSVIANDRIEAAGVFGADGTLMAQFRRDYETGSELPTHPGAAGHHFSGSTVELVQAAEAAGSQLGSVYIRATTQGLWSERLDYLAPTGLAGLIGLIPAFGALHLLRKRVIGPIEIVSKQAEVLAQGDLREFKLEAAEAEVGTLVAGFERLGGSLRELARHVRVEVEEIENARLALSERSEAATRRAAGQATTVEAAARSLESLGDSFDVFAASLADLSTESRLSASAAEAIQVGARSVLQSSESLAQATRRVASATEQTSASIQQIAGSVAELDEVGERATGALRGLAESVETVRGRAERAGLLSRQSEASVRSGQATVEESSLAMADVSGAFGRIEHEVRGLADLSRAIAAIVSTIDRITVQTQLLSINASIIAAQAGGTAGQAFAVVATQVSHLADQTSGSASEIGALIKAVQLSVAETVLATKVGREAVEQGEARTGRATETLTEVLVRACEAAEFAEESGRVAEEHVRALGAVETGIVAMRKRLSEIVAAVHEQENAARQVSASVAEGDSLAQQLRSAAEEQLRACDVSGRSVSEVEDLAKRMVELIDSQRLGAGTIRDSLPLFRDSVRSTLVDVEHIGSLVDALAARSERLRRGIENLRTE